EICAGDIVRYAAFDIEVITDVYFSDGAFWVRSTLLGEVAQKTDVEIIGDIYQSPELLPFIRELGGSRCYGA
ncbi:YopX family protein, partial [Effusibacillus pohliae]